jgi:predicted thioesterase
MELTGIEAGMKQTAKQQVTSAELASSMGSGSLPVYATPAMSCLMEKAAADLAEPFMPAGWTTVGIAMAIQHKASTPVGMQVYAEAEVTAVEGRKISYKVMAYDGSGEIGSGIHTRFAVQKDRFMAKTREKSHNN